MIFLSTEFKKAFEAEMERLFAEKMEDYWRSEDGFSRMDRKFEQFLKEMSPFLSCSIHQYQEGAFDRPLRIYLGDPNVSFEYYLDIEELVGKEIEESPTEDLKYLLHRLQKIVGRVRDHLATLPNETK